MSYASVQIANENRGYEMDLFTPLQIGDLALPNRIVMSPLTRCRA
ncbi:MAG: hypothetical protein KDD44_13685, partial [Bdellovibrionales bacterium]|nr:hypothetical protein [Bdellovibrionales bacterium]